MADNVTANAGSGGATFAAPELSFSGDTTKLPIGSGGLLTGSEGSWTFTLLVGGAGAVSAGTQRVTLGSDDPAVSSLASIKTAVETLDNAISGSEMQVDVVGALPAGTNNIGDVDVLSIAAGDNNIGNVDIVTVPSDPFGANADAASATGSISAKLRFMCSTGIPITGSVTVAQATASNLNATVVGTGTFAVQATCTNAGTFVVQVDGTALTRLTDIETNTDSGAVVGNGAAATAQRVTLANDSTGVIATVSNVATIGTSVTPGTGASNLGKAEDAGHTSGDVGVMALTVRQDSAAALGGTDADYQPLITDSSGRLHVNVGNTVTVGSHAVTNAGTFAVQVDGAALTALQLIDDPVFTDDGAFTPGTSKVMVAGFEADESSTDSVDEGDAGAARMTLDRKVIVTPQPHTAGGLAIFRTLDLDETEEEVKASAGQVYGAWVTNTATTTRWIKFYNATAANVSVGSTTPVITIGIPGNTSDDISGVLGNGGMGIAFDTAITVAATTGVADADTGAPSANDVILNVFYK